MPIPHQEMRRMIKRRMVGTEGNERIAVLQACLAEFPDYYNGPYGELRRWALDLIDQTRVQKGTKHQEQFAIPKEGASQVVLVGPPNAGKSSLLKALTGRQVVVGDYPFTTLRPIAGMLKVGGAVVQIVDLPGLLDGAVDGKGGGKALLACIRSADALLYIVPATDDGILDARAVADEVERAGITLPTGVVVTKTDLGAVDQMVPVIAELFPSLPRVSCSCTRGVGLDDVRQLVWDLTGLMRIYPKPRGGASESEAIVLPPGATVQDFVAAIYRQWVDIFKQAKVTGPSAKFPAMPVGLHHPLQDGDTVELILQGR